jgi:hypothetical protein
MSKQSTTDRKIAAAQQAARDADYFARTSQTLDRFMRAHARDQEGGISPCQANMAMIDEKMDALLLDGTDPQTYEIILLSLGDKLIRVNDPVIFKPVPHARRS